MKQIRRNVFETNSSSVHSLTMCSYDEYEQWKDGKVLFWGNTGTFGTKAEIISELKNKRYTYCNNKLCYPDVNWDNEDELEDVFSEEGITDWNNYFNDNEYETFRKQYTTKSGDEIIAFGYYGEDC